MISSMISWGNSMVIMAEEYRVSVNQGTSGVSDAGRSRGDFVRGLDGYRWELAVKARSFPLTAFEVSSGARGTWGMTLTSRIGRSGDYDRVSRRGNADKKITKPSPSKYPSWMPKRSRPDPTNEEEDSFSGVPSDGDQGPDIFAALTGQKKRRISESEDDDEDLQDIIRQATAKRDVKEGTQVIKKAKGKTKIAKGEVGGGSFQSMGE